MDQYEEIKIKMHRDTFSRIAFWQTLAFVLLLCFVWAGDLLDIPSRVFGTEPTPFNLYRTCLVSAAVFVAAVITVGHTYEQQRSLLNKLLRICVKCRRAITHHES